MDRKEEMKEGRKGERGTKEVRTKKGGRKEGRKEGRKGVREEAHTHTHTQLCTSTSVANC